MHAFLPTYFILKPIKLNESKYVIQFQHDFLAYIRRLVIEAKFLVFYVCFFKLNSDKILTRMPPVSGSYSRKIT